jgi:hypothetical protein
LSGKEFRINAIVDENPPANHPLHRWKSHIDLN